MSQKESGQEIGRAYRLQKPMQVEIYESESQCPRIENLAKRTQRVIHEYMSRYHRLYPEIEKIYMSHYIDQDDIVVIQSYRKEKELGQKWECHLQDDESYTRTPEEIVVSRIVRAVYKYIPEFKQKQLLVFHFDPEYISDIQIPN
ncbi:MAG: hypothetical protein U9Q15_01970 [Patescibacteria group bacterium]|nr:hypothetical protein [Patescibacteria group bacterium]